MRFMALFFLLYLFLLDYSRIEDKFIVELNERIYKIPSNIGLTSGGCGFMALYIHDKLPGSQLVNFYSDDVELRHFMVKCHGLYGDARGFRRTPVWNVYKCRPVTRSYLVSKLNEVWRWKKKFNRADTAIIKRFLN